MIKIAVVNASTVVTDQDADKIVAAVQKQVTRDWAPVWGITAELSFIPKGHRPPPDHWWGAILDDLDVSGALGYHDLTSKGLPLFKVGAKLDLMYGDAVSVTVSHEVLEMLADPDVNLFVQGDKPDRFFAYEVCDAVEADEYGYDIDGVRVSDFVFPSFFETFRLNVGPFDFKSHLRHGMPHMLQGGYLSYVEAGQWHQIIAAAGIESRFKARPRVGSRRYRRELSRREWLPSIVETA